IRALIVRQANQYLTATLDIRELGGSLFTGLELGGITLSQDNRPIIAIDRVRLRYSLRELVQNGTIIPQSHLMPPPLVPARLPDGRWNLSALVKREAREEERTGPGRPVEIQAIEISDGDIQVLNPLDFGAVHAPTSYTALNASLSFAYQPVKWTLTFG